MFSCSKAGRCGEQNRINRPQHSTENECSVFLLKLHKVFETFIADFLLVLAVVVAAIIIAVGAVTVIAVIAVIVVAVGGRRFSHTSIWTETPTVWIY